MFEQVANPVAGSLALSALVAALPLITLFVLLGALKWKAWQAGLASLVVALGVAVFAFGMPAGQALLAASEGAAFGLFPIIWIVLTAIWIFRLTELTGYDLVLRRAFGSLSPDQRIQAIIIAFCFGALLEALAGFGTPVAVTAVMLIAVGISPIKAASVALVANTAPVAFGAIAVPITTLGKITGLDPNLLGAMVGRQTPLLAVFVPLILVLMVDGKRGVRQTWLAALVGGAAFAIAQFLSSNYFNYQVADIIAALAGALALVLLLRVWQPSEIVSAEPIEINAGTSAVLQPVGPSGSGGNGAGGSAKGGAASHSASSGPVSKREALLAFAPYLIVVVLFTLTS
ncbi:MAG: L-lactate permease, partial [Nakamurella sp.]